MPGCRRRAWGVGARAWRRHVRRSEHIGQSTRVFQINYMSNGTVADAVPTTARARNHLQRLTEK